MPAGDYPCETSEKCRDRSGSSAGATGSRERRRERRRRGRDDAAGEAASVTSWASVEGLAPSELESALVPIDGGGRGSRRRTARGSTASADNVGVDVPNCCTSSTRSNGPTSTAAPRNSASTTDGGSVAEARRCARSTTPARRPSWTTRARSRASSTRRRASGSRWSYSSPCSALPIYVRGGDARGAGLTGSAATRGPSRTLAVSPRQRCATSSSRV